MTETATPSPHLEHVKQEDTNTECETPDSSPERTPDKDYSNWPLDKIKEPGLNDVLYGRGGGTNHHDGNKRYRKKVEKRKVDYVNSKRLDKPLVALEIIREWRHQIPPGRFLKLDEANGLWQDVGDKKAREKTSQALREKAPLLRKQQDEIIQEQKSKFDKTTRFHPNSNASSKEVKADGKIRRARLGGRVDSLGTQVPDNIPLSMKGFSWDSNEAAAPIADDESPNESYTTHPLPDSVYDNSYLSPPSIPPETKDRKRPPYEREHSLAYNTLDGASTTIPTPKSFLDDYQNQWQPHPHSGAYVPSSSRSDPESNQNDWTHRKSSHTHDQGYNRQIRSAENDYRSHDSGYPQRWDGYMAPQTYNRSYNEWASPARSASQDTHSYPTSYSSPYHTVPTQLSSSSSDPYHNPNHQYPPNFSPRQHSSTYNSDISKSFASEVTPKRTLRNFGSPRDSDNSCSPSRSIPRPQPIKRDTSHQCETDETKPSIKRMNRQRSIGNGQYGKIANDVTNLGRHLRQSSIGEVVPDKPTTSSLLKSDFKRTMIAKPNLLGSSDRVQTIDQFECGIEGATSHLDDIKDMTIKTKPKPVDYDDRRSSIESFSLEDVSRLISTQPPFLNEAGRDGTLGSIEPVDLEVPITSV